jgi:hypothetical protein
MVLSSATGDVVRSLEGHTSKVMSFLHLPMPLDSAVPQWHIVLSGSFDSTYLEEILTETN